jgi:hypothetical protein
MYKRKSVAILLATMMVVLPAVVVAAPASAMPRAAAAPPPTSGTLTTAIVQTINGVGTFAGTLTVNSFSLVNGVINAVGTISGTFTPLTGAATTIPATPVTIPLASFTGTCTILTLHTGAIHLSVLGLNIDLSPIDLVITATAAPGNLLGNLLCALVHLLDSNASLGAVTSLLNQILSAIRV